MRTKLLILGGTGDAAALAWAVEAAYGPHIGTITSLAGRAGIPDLPGQVRVGGFGGAEGLQAYLKAEAIDRVIDATHPFAARISAHAEAACAALGLPRLVLARPEWMPRPGDRWVEVASMAEAAAALPRLGRCAFLTVGAGEATAFAHLPEVWFLVRLLKDEPLPLARYGVVTARPPFTVEGERRLMQDHAIDLLVSKNSGGTATYAKIEAARTLGLPVLMIRRPPPPGGPMVETVQAAVEWIGC